MKLYRHWVKEAATITVDGEPLEIHCYGRSNGSVDAAIANAPRVYGDLLLAQSRSGMLAALRIEPIRDE